MREINHGFANGKKLAVVIANEHASPNYNTDFLRRVFEQEGGEFSEARSIVLGHLQRGGAPRAFDRILGARLGTAAMTAAIAQLRAGQANGQPSASARAASKPTPSPKPCARWTASTTARASSGGGPCRDLLRLLAQPEPGWNEGVAARGS